MQVTSHRAPLNSRQTHPPYPLPPPGLDYFPGLHDVLIVIDM